MERSLSNNNRTGKSYNQRVSRECEFRIVDGKMITVGIPRAIELEGLVARFNIKPWTDRTSRSYLEAAVQAARSSLRAVPIGTNLALTKVPVPHKKAA